jgi:hypothetical protein
MSRTGKGRRLIEGFNHLRLYDVPIYVEEAVSILASFFKSRL